MTEVSVISRSPQIELKFDLPRTGLNFRRLKIALSSCCKLLTTYERNRAKQSFYLIFFGVDRAHGDDGDDDNDDGDLCYPSLP